MDDFVNILQRDYGLKPHGKSAPMTAAKTADPLSSSASIYRTTSPGTSRNGSSRGSRILTSIPAETQQDDTLFASNGPTRNDSGSVGDDLLADGGGGVVHDDVFGGPPKSAPPVHPSCPSAATYTSGLDDPFGFPVKQQSPESNKSSSLPVFDEPFYEEDIFGGVHGIKSTSAQYDDVFGSGGGFRVGTSPGVLADFLGEFGVSESRGKTSSDQRAAFAPEVRSSQSGDTETDELLPGFRGVEPRSMADVKPPQAKSLSVENEFTAMSSQQPIEAKDSDYMSSDIAFDSIDTASIKCSASSSERKDSSTTFDEDVSSDSNLPSSSAAQPSNQKVGNPGRQTKFDGMTTNPGLTIQASMDTEDGTTVFLSCKGQMPHDKVHDPSQLSKSLQSQRVDEIWISVDEVKLMTQLTSAPPPSRPPPVPASKQGYGSRKQSMLKAESKNALANEFYDSTFSNNTSPLHDYEDNSAGPKEASAAENDITMGVAAASASSAAMIEAIERAKAKAKAEEKEWEARATRLREEWEKARQAREREEEREAYMQEKGKEADKEAQEREEREREAREKRQKETEKERERGREKDRRAVERAAQEARKRAERAAVERAIAEARERAAAEAWEKAAAEAQEKAAAKAQERAAAEARERAAAEARERAAAEAKERAAFERATMEARERAAADARDRAERAAVERAASEARARAERAAVERALTEAQQRAAEKAAAEAWERAATEKAAAAAREQQQMRNENDLEAFFSSTSRAGSAPKQRSPNMDASSKGAFSEAAWKGPSSTSNVVKKVHSASAISDDWTSLFGVASHSPAPAFGEFQEVEGRRSRWERHQRTLERTAKALEVKNQRDLQTKRDQEERRRVGDALDAEIKRWAAGKEGNLRALLSTLQYVLWPECGWQPISLTDLITAAAVKKVYRKATLCVHPDKVQQKGATVQQKYIAEKVFNLLKEAWSKFNSEELF